MIVPAIAPHSLVVRCAERRRAWSESSHRLRREYRIDVTPEGDLIGDWEDDFLTDYTLLLEDEAAAQGRAAELPEPFDMSDLEDQRDEIADEINVERVHLTGPGLLP